MLNINIYSVVDNPIFKKEKNIITETRGLNSNNLYSTAISGYKICNKEYIYTSERKVSNLLSICSSSLHRYVSPNTCKLWNQSIKNSITWICKHSCKFLFYLTSIFSAVFGSIKPLKAPHNNLKPLPALTMNILCKICTSKLIR
jgi:hypothetical protein